MASGKFQYKKLTKNDVKKLAQGFGSKSPSMAMFIPKKTPPETIHIETSRDPESSQTWRDLVEDAEQHKQEQIANRMFKFIVIPLIFITFVSFILSIGIQVGKYTAIEDVKNGNINLYQGVENGN